MKAIISVLFSVIIIFCSCKKHKDAIVLINCNGLVTDTLGTGDTARIYMATAFTPNADGVNDLLRPILKSAASFVFTLYDESNNIVYTTNQPWQGYSPSTAPATFIKYYYKVQVTTLGGHHIGECGEVYSLSCLPSGVTAASIHFEDELTQDGWDNTSLDPVLGVHCP